MTDDERKERLRRIVVGLHPSPHGRAALEAAAHLAALLGAELEGIYVQEERLMRIPQGSILRQVDAVSGRVRPLEAGDVERELRVEAARARRHLARIGEEMDVEWSFRTARGEVHAVVREAARAVDVVTLGAGTRTPAGGLGSTVRTMVTQAGHPVMVIRRGMRLGPHVHAVDDGSDAGRRAVELARALTEHVRSGLTVHVGSQTDAEERAEGYRKELQEDGRSDAVVLTAPGRGAAAPLAERQCGLLVLPRTSLEDGADALERIVRHSACPILVI